MLLLSRINACPCTAMSAYARVPCWCTSLAHPFCFCASSGLMRQAHTEKFTKQGNPGSWQKMFTLLSPNSVSGCEQHLRSPQSSFNSRVFNSALSPSWPVPLPLRLPQQQTTQGSSGERFSIFLLCSIVCLLCIYENRSLEIFVKVREDATRLLLVKLLQSEKMKPFSGTWPRQKAQQERETKKKIIQDDISRMQ